jgi:hypothetical protein
VSNIDSEIDDMRARKATKTTKREQGGRKTKPETVSTPEVTSPESHLNGSAAEPITPTTPTVPEKKEPTVSWEKALPYASDVKTKGAPVVLNGPAGTFTVHFNKVEAAQKDQRWSITDATTGAVVASRSDYWTAVLEARRRSLGK